MISALVDRFLAWQLPKTVCSDTCVTDRNYPYPHLRTGTSLLTADEARQMMEHLFAVVIADSSMKDVVRALVRYRMHDGRADLPPAEIDRMTNDGDRSLALWIVSKLREGK